MYAELQNPVLPHFAGGERMLNSISLQHHATKSVAKRVPCMDFFSQKILSNKCGTPAVAIVWVSDEVLRMAIHVERISQANQYRKCIYSEQCHAFMQ